MASIVLVHGAMHGAWCWYKTIPHLEKFGHSVLAVDLPGHGRNVEGGALSKFDDYVDHVAQVLREMEDVILVGHSLGGAVISAVAERLPKNIARLVYLCAIVPENDQSPAVAAAINGVSAMAENVLLDMDSDLPPAGPAVITRVCRFDDPTPFFGSPGLGVSRPFSR